MRRADKVWNIRRRCIRANEGVLWDDHGNVLKRVIRRQGEVQGIAVPTKLTLTDVLQTWEWVYQRTADRRDDDEDTTEAYKEIAARIEALWDGAPDDLLQQSDKVIDLLADHLLADIPRAKSKRR